MSWEKAASRSGVIIARVLDPDSNPIKRGLREIALRLECRNPFLQVGVEIDDAILDRAIEPIELFISDSQFSC